MKTYLAAILLGAFCISAAAQSARQLTRRIEPLLPPRPQTGAPGAAAPGAATPTAPNRTPEQIAAQKAESEKKAFEFHLKRANEGSERAQYDVGMRYLTGTGVAKDEKTGLEWLTKASTNGSTEAQKKLVELQTKTAPKK